MPKKCPTTGKKKYFSHKEARKGITFIWSNDPSIKMGDLHTYQCPSCRAVHIGHTVPKPVREGLGIR